MSRLVPDEPVRAGETNAVVTITRRMVGARCQSGAPSGHGRTPGRVPAALTTGVLLLALMVTACGGSSQPKHSRPAHSTAAVQPSQQSTGTLDGPTLANPVQAPPLVLPNYQHQQVNLASYRGHAALVTFIYTHCPDVCPLIVANLHNTLALLGPRSSEVRVIGVSVDPRGDTPQAIRQFLAAHEMMGKMQYLVATRPVMEPVWHDWRVDASTPGANEEVNHSAMVYGISATGKVMTVYPANFKPAELAHDVPILASS